MARKVVIYFKCPICNSYAKVFHTQTYFRYPNIIKTKSYKCVQCKHNFLAYSFEILAANIDTIIEKFNIDRDIPLYDTTLGCYRKFPLKELEIGDSFFIPQEWSDKHYKNQCGFYSTFSRFSKRNNKKILAKKVEGGYRVWRIE